MCRVLLYASSLIPPKARSHSASATSIGGGIRLYFCPKVAKCQTITMAPEKVTAKSGLGSRENSDDKEIGAASGSAAVTGAADAVSSVRLKPLSPWPKQNAYRRSS